MAKTLLVFDLDDTLMPEHGPVHQALAATVGEVDGDSDELIAAVRRHGEAIWSAGPFAAFGNALGISWWEAMTATFERDGPRMDELRPWAQSFRVQVWAAALHDCGHGNISIAERLAAQFMHERTLRYVAYDGAKEMLDALRPRFRLAMLTNGPGDMQRLKLERAGLDGLFDPLVVSGDEGVGKPDVRIFERLLERAGVAASDALMIGNSLSSDIAGANAAGIECVWLNHDGDSRTPQSGEGRPDHIITDITQLPRVVLQ